jgi:hypothetical protein
MSHDIVLLALQALECCASDSKTHARIVFLIRLRQILDVAASFASSAPLQVVVWRLLGALQSSVYCVQNFVSADGIAAAFDAMVRFTDDADVVAACVGALSRVVAVPEGLSAFLSSGGIPRVAGLFGSHSGSTAVVGQCLRLLSVACYKHPDQKLAIAHAVGLPRVVSVMTTFAGEAGLQRDACKLVRNLSSQPELQQALVGYRAMDRLFAAADAFPEDAVIQTDVCGALAYLSLCEANKPAMHAQCLPRIYRAMTTHPDACELQEQCVWTLGNLCFRQPKFQVAVVATGGCERVLAVSKGWPSLAGLQRGCMKALLNLSLCPTGREKLRLLDAVSHVRSVMARLPTFEEVQKIGGQLLHALTGV